MSEMNSVGLPLPKTPAAPLHVPFLKPLLQWSLSSLLPALLGFGLLLCVWQLLALQSPGLPTPQSTFMAAIELFSHPFYVNSPNDRGIGWNVLASLGRVGLGFGLAAVVGIPLGFLLGRWNWLGRMFDPIIALLKPVSPLAWLPIGLLLFNAAAPASIYVIFISSIWPLIINTALGVRQVPEDYLNLAKVLNLSETKILTKILIPATLPYVLSGIRLSLGTAWLVIVAAEMLTGGVGLGFWIWDEWNNLNMEHIIVAIFVVGVVGLTLEAGLLRLGRKLNYAN